MPPLHVVVGPCRQVVTGVPDIVDQFQQLLVLCLSGQLREHIGDVFMWYEGEGHQFLDEAVCSPLLCVSHLKIETKSKYYIILYYIILYYIILYYTILYYIILYYIIYIIIYYYILYIILYYKLHVYYIL